MSKDKQILYLDLDNTLFNLIETILNRYNIAYNDNLSVKDFVHYDVTRHIKPECKHLFNEFGDEDTFMHLSPYPGVVDAIEYLNEKYQVYYASAGHPYTQTYRNNLLMKWFPSFKTRQLIMIRDKHLLVGDALVDDSYENLVYGNYRKFLMDFPWNQNLDEKKIGAKRLIGWNTGTLAVIDDVMERKREREARSA